jgi:DNA-binding response OmpR family regulator
MYSTIAMAIDHSIMTQTILVVDDEPKITRLLSDYLENAGFRVVTAHDGPGALSRTEHERPDLIVLDLMLPGMDGLDVARELRRRGDVPIIMLTARVEETDRLIGLELGADDYVTKPFSPREVVARVRAVLRRAGGAQEPPDLVRAGDVVVDLRGHQASVGGRVLDLTPTEFDLLIVLAANPGQVFTRGQLLDRLRGVSLESYERAIDAHVGNLRRKLEDDPRQPCRVVTVYGVGYKFVPVEGK